MRSTRDAFGAALLALGEKRDDVIVLSADLSKATRTDAFAKCFPDRFIEVGIAEANMIGIASGLSENGFRPFISSFGSFITGRYDIIRCSLAYPRCPVVVAGSHSGMAIGKDGTTQMGLEDVSLMRSLPNMMVVQPSTYAETIETMEAIADYDGGPVYLRLGRQPVPDIDLGSDAFKLGKIRTVKHGYDMTIVYSGCVGHVALGVADTMWHAGITCRILDVHTLKPFDADTLVKPLGILEPIVTIEDHSTVGGLGSIVADVVCKSSPTRVMMIGVNDCFVSSGDPDDLYSSHGITVEKIVERIRSELLL